jgi:lysophospholipid acyltransferase (LPLAT)-like uncharacterized protein
MAKFIHTPIGLSLTSFLAWGFIRSLGRTVHLQILGQEKIIRLSEKEDFGILALWHGRHFLLVDQYRRQFTNRKKMCVMTSESKDGELLARILRKFNFRVVRGSSSRGAVSGLMKLIDVMREGYDTIIAVDGPRGPREVVKSGVIVLAQKTGYPIIPLSASAKQYWLINSWDRYMIPKPFTSGVVSVGDPIYVSANANKNELEQKRLLVETSLKEITLQADKFFTKG